MRDFLLLFADKRCNRNARAREFDGPSNFEWYWSVPPWIS